MSDNLFPMVQKLIDHILTVDFPRNGYALIKAGQRSGKTELALALAKQGKFETLFLDSGNDHIQFLQHRNTSLDCKILSYDTIFKNVSLTDSNQLVIIDEPFYRKGTYEKFLYAREREIPVLVIGSRGPEYDEDERWKFVPGYSFNTWDLNPHSSLGFLAENFGLTPKVIRDFFAF